MELVLGLDDVDATMLDRVGGKGLSLGLLTRAGFDVPPGFCLTTTGYRAAVGDRLAPVLSGTSDDSTTDDAATGPVEEWIGARAAAARRIVLDAPLPEAVAAAVQAAYRSLGEDVPVAVRSSATAEDLPDASFAGQQDTFLNVVGGSALLAAVRRCWASLWTDRAMAYRVHNQIDQRAVALAVVVQRMVDAETAGVLFTADPVTGTRTHTVIDASPGLGEAVVSGAVNPDHVLADSASGTVLEQRIGDKRVAIRSRDGGGTVREVLPGSADPCLSAAQIATLVELGRRVQEFAGSPQDLEWAIDSSGRVWLTQARPITTLYPVPQSSQSGPRVFLCMSLAQGLTRPITPLGLSVYRRMGSGVVDLFGGHPTDPERGPAGLVAAGQRQFIDITPVLARPATRRIVLRLTAVMEARTRTVLEGLVADGRIPTPAAGDRNGSVLRTVVSALRISGLPVRLVSGWISPGLAYRGVARLERRLRARLVLVEPATPEERLAFVEDRLATDTFVLMPRTIGYAVGGFAALALGRRLLRGLAEPAEVQSVLRGLPRNVTTEMDLRLWDLTTRIRADAASAAAYAEQTVTALTDRYRAGQLPPIAQQGLRDFLVRYGHRAVAEIDPGLPRWSEEPEHLIAAIANYLRLTDPELAPDQAFARGAAAGIAAVTELTARARRRGPVRARLVGWSLSRARALTGLREHPKFLLVLSLARLRAQVLLVGAAAAEVGGIAEAADVCWLELAEIRRALHGEPLQELVAERKAAYERELRRRHVPRILLSDGTEPEAGSTGPHSEGGLRGSPASAGVVTGIARVVLDPQAARLEPGEILVAPSTDPGWTPLFLTAGGLVMEMGGSNSHGAVVAREYGIPAVVGVPDATGAIRTGQTITVDGGAGQVLIEPADVRT